MAGIIDLDGFSLFTTKQVGKLLQFLLKVTIVVGSSHSQRTVIQVSLSSIPLHLWSPLDALSDEIELLFNEQAFGEIS